MLELLIALLMSLGINFTISETGSLEMSSKDYNTLKESASFQKSEGISTNDIVINDGIDPTALSTSSK